MSADNWMQKQDAKKARSYVMTFNNYTENDVEIVKGFMEANCTWGIFGKEVGSENGTPHLQGAFTMPNPRAWGSMKKLIKGWWVEPMRGSPKQSETYCSKQGEVWEHGVKPMQGKRSDVCAIREMVKSGANMRDLAEICISASQLTYAEKLRNIYSEKRDWEVDVFWLYGASGTGKSRFAKEQAPLAWWSGRNLKWWDGYDKHEDVIIDDFRGDFCTLHELLRITDRHEYMIEVKGSVRQLLCKRIFITAPYHPEKIYKNCKEDLRQLARRMKYRVFYFDEDADYKYPREEMWDGIRR